jgi:hypothetical protein
MGLFIGNDFFWIVLPVLSDRETMARVSCPWAEQFAHGLGVAVTLEVF